MLLNNKISKTLNMCSQKFPPKRNSRLSLTCEQKNKSEIDFFFSPGREQTTPASLLLYKTTIMQQAVSSLAMLQIINISYISEVAAESW